MKWLCVPLVLSLVALDSARAELAFRGHPEMNKGLVHRAGVQMDDLLFASTDPPESAAVATAMPPPERDPIRTVIRMFAAFEDRDAEGWVQAMSHDYRFDSDDPSFAESHPSGFTRADEAAFVTHLFVGGGRAPDGRALPIATRVEAPLGAAWVEMRDIGATRAIAHVERFAYRLTLADGSQMMLAGSDNVLELALEADEWRVRAWHERTGTPGAVAARPAVEPGASADALPARLAIRRLGGLAGSAIALELALPAPGGVLELFDVAGRRIARRDLAGITAGVRRVEIPSGGVPPGTYWARVRQEGSVATARVVRLR